jgi:uncharacterized protein YbgA (DUF1722 family)
MNVKQLKSGKEDIRHIGLLLNSLHCWRLATLLEHYTAYFGDYVVNQDRYLMECECLWDLQEIHRVMYISQPFKCSNRAWVNNYNDLKVRIKMQTLKVQMIDTILTHAQTKLSRNLNRNDQRSFIEKVSTFTDEGCPPIEKELAIKPVHLQLAEVV